MSNPKQNPELWYHYFDATSDETAEAIARGDEILTSIEKLNNVFVRASTLDPGTGHPVFWVNYSTDPNSEVNPFIN